MGGSSAYEGRVEVCIDKVWGTISDDGWIVNDAVVVCRQLGYSDQCKRTMRTLHFYTSCYSACTL